jgi:hypothetical protein
MCTYHHDDCYSRCWEFVHGVMMTVIELDVNGYMACSLW